MKKKILLLVMSLFLMTNILSARPNFYCSVHGNLYQFIYYTQPDGSVRVEAMWIGHCMNFGELYSPVVNSYQEGGSSEYQEVSEQMYSAFQHYTFNGTLDTTSSNYQSDKKEISDLTSDSTAIYNLQQTTPQWINPDNVPTLVSEQFAKADGKSIYALTIKDSPFTSSAHFDLWSTVKQTLNFSICSADDGSILYSTSINLVEGKNSDIYVSLPATPLNGTFLMVLKTSSNEIRTKVVIIEKN